MERKTLDCVCCNPGCDFVDYYVWLHDSLTGWLWPYLILFIDPHWMVAPMPWIWIIVYSVMDGCTHTAYISCIWDISCTSPRRFSDAGVFSWTRSRKAFHPSLSLGPHALGGICYTIICHRPCNPHTAHWRAHFVTCEKWHALKPFSWHPSEQELSLPWRHLLVENPKIDPFCIGAGRQCSTHTNGENSSKRSRQLVLCPRVALAPANLRSVF